MKTYNLKTLCITAILGISFMVAATHTATAAASASAEATALVKPKDKHIKARLKAGTQLNGVAYRALSPGKHTAKPSRRWRKRRALNSPYNKVQNKWLAGCGWN